jgi:hypothetical protein
LSGAQKPAARNKPPDQFFLGRLIIKGCHPERSRGIPPQT